MGLFDQILGAVANPNQQGSLNQIGGIINAVQQLSGNTGADSSAMQSIMSVVGGQVRSALQNKQANEGPDAVQALVSQFAGNSANPSAVASLFSPAMQQQVAEIAAQRTGMDVGMIQQMLPAVVPMVLNFLNSGQNTQGGDNPVLSSFLDADGDGDTDIADVMQMASRYMGQ
jgi:predicted metal-binding membrane protein